VSYVLRCPNCGVREVTDFGYGGERNEYVYFRTNVAGVQREWWHHRSGCRAWFIAERDTRTNEVLSVALP